MIVAVSVKPRTSKNKLEITSEDSIKVSVTAPPIGGAANRMIVDVLSESLGVPKTSISIIKGHKSRKKMVEINGIDALPFTETGQAKLSFRE